MEVKYKSFFGKEFNTEKECLEAEEKRRKHTFYVKVLSHPDLTETGLMTHLDLFRVYSEITEKDMLVFVILKEMKIAPIGSSVQGYGYQEHCRFRYISEKEFENPEPIIWGGFRLSFYKYDVIINREVIINKL